MVFHQADCWDAVSQTTEETKKNNDWKKAVDEALMYIGLTILPGQYGHIWTAKDGAEAWKALADIYEKNSCTIWISLIWQFYGCQYNTNNSIQSYISGISSLTAQVEALGITLSPRHNQHPYFQPQWLLLEYHSHPHSHKGWTIHCRCNGCTYWWRRKAIGIRWPEGEGCEWCGAVCMSTEVDQVFQLLKDGTYGVELP